MFRLPPATAALHSKSNWKMFRVDVYTAARMNFPPIDTCSNIWWKAPQAFTVELKFSCCKFLQSFSQVTSVAVDEKLTRAVKACRAKVAIFPGDIGWLVISQMRHQVIIIIIPSKICKIQTTILRSLFRFRRRNNNGKKTRNGATQPQVYYKEWQL